MDLPTRSGPHKSIPEYLHSKQGNHWELGCIYGAKEKKWGLFLNALSTGDANIISNGKFFPDQIFGAATIIV